MMNNSDFYRLLYLCRKVEEAISVAVNDGRIRWPVHLSTGQEFLSVGICTALLPEDIVFGTYRGHALYLSKGGDLKKMIAELYGKKTGCSQGKGGSMHLIDTNIGFMGTSGIVATGISNAVGYAYGLRCQGSKKIVVCVFGDGAVDEGAFYESLNFAALKKLNIIFFCENNSYAIRSHQSARHSVSNITEKAKSFGIDAEKIPSRTEIIYKNIRNTRSEMLNKPGPRFFECFACRWKEHLGPNNDYNMSYRSLKDVNKWIKKDELKRVGQKLDPGIKHRIEDKVKQEIEDAFSFAESSPLPDLSDLYSNVFCGDKI